MSTRSFFVPLQPPTLNDLKVSPDGRGRWRYDTVKRVWARWIPPLVRPKRASGPVRMTVTRFYGGKRGMRPYDRDNFEGGLKPVLDLLKGTYILDDRPGTLITVYQQFPAAEKKHEPGTLFEFEDLNGVER